MEAVEALVRDTQILIEASQTVDTSDATTFNVAGGSLTQNFYSGFKTNPLDENVSDQIFFAWEIDAPVDAVPAGSSMYNWVTYRLKSDTTG